MLPISKEMRDDTRQQLGEYEQDHKPSPLDYIDCLENILCNAKYDKYAPGYPRTIKLAKSLEELAQGDTEPSYTFTLPGPILYHGIPIWEGDCGNNLSLQAGHRNSDRRYLSNYCISTKKPYAHMTLAGATGMGKSVALNSFLMSMFFMYPPWELHVYMADPKISEFSRYGSLHHIPHIVSIAATGDMGYVASMLDHFVERMKLSGNAFEASTGTTNLSEFKKVSGLVLPRNIFVFDEYQTALQTAETYKKRIVKDLDLIARLGRSAGFNEILCSQEVDPEVKPILSNIPIRFCLKASPSVSEMILGNKQATQGRMGLVYANDNPNADNSIEFNQRFIVPLQTTEEFQELGTFLEEAGKSIDIVAKTNYYNEKRLIYQKDLEKMIESRESTDELVLGEPSFISDHPDRFFINYDYSDICNTMVLTPRADNLKRYFLSIMLNAKNDIDRKQGGHVIFLGDTTVKNTPGLDLSFTSKSIHEFRNVEEQSWLTIIRIVYTRMMLLDVDRKAFANPVINDKATIECMNKWVDPRMYSDLTKSRLYYLLNMLKTDEKRLGTLFGYNNPVEAGAAIRFYFSMLTSLGNNFLREQVTEANLKTQTVHVVGVNKIQGIGRDGASRHAKILKPLLYDANRAKTKFIFYATSTEDWISEYRSAFRYFILDGSTRMATAVKCDGYPASIPSVNAIVFDSFTPDDSMKSFKKVAFPMEVF